MIETQYIWKNGKLIPWKDAQSHVLTHSLHYGSAVFEGIRCYKTNKGPAIFKLLEHIQRFFYSARQLGMQIPYSIADICKAAITIVQENGIEEAYLRPLAYYGYGSMKVVPTSDLPVDVIIACWPWADYLAAEAVDIAISPYIRIHPKSTVADAKISGHYVNSILAGLAIRNTHYHEALLLDSNGYVAEGGAENIFIVKDGKIITTPEGTILVGITRNTVMQIAEELKIPVIEKSFKPEEIYSADEAFFTGTAVEITAIRSLNDKNIGQGCTGAITKKIQTRYYEIIRGQVPKYYSELSFVKDEYTEVV